MFPKIRGTLLGKDYSILGSILGSLYFEKLPVQLPDTVYMLNNRVYSF